MPKPATKIDRFRGRYRFLSNFYPSPFAYEQVFPNGTSILYNARTVEHAYQAYKAILPARAELILNAKMPGHAKRLGTHNKIRSDWDQIKLNVMRRLLERKFYIRYLAERLLATGAVELIEGNVYHDTYWGVDLDTGLGENHLGRLLMEIRSKLHRNEVDA